MPTYELKSKEECEDFVRGCTVLGTGGGGAPERGIKLLHGALDAGLRLGWRDVSQIADDVWVVCPFLMGSIAPRTPQAEAEMLTFGLNKIRYPNAIMNAIQELETYSGKEIGAVIPIELGGGNTAESVVQSARLSLPTVDADYAGRAIPEIIQITPVIYDKSLAPLSAVDEWGNIAIIKEAVNPPMAERLGKLLSVAAFGLACMAGILLKGREVKEIAIPGTLTASLKLGQAIRQARAEGADPLAAATKAMNGWLLFKGVVTEKEWEDRAGYLWGTHTLDGVEEFAGRSFKVWYKNENHVSWLDGQLYVMSPDLVCLVDLQTAEPITNTNIATGHQLAAIGRRGAEMFRTKKGLENLGPAHFGFDVPYVPIEQIV